MASPLGADGYGSPTPSSADWKAGPLSAVLMACTAVRAFSEALPRTRRGTELHCCLARQQAPPGIPIVEEEGMPLNYPRPIHLSSPCLNRAGATPVPVFFIGVDSLETS